VALTLTSLNTIPLIRRDDDLADIILKSLRAMSLSLEDNDILVLTSKIISKSEGRMVDLKTVTPSPRALELARQSEKDARVVELMLQESRDILRVRAGTIIVEHRLGFVCANAGIDHSNVRPDPASGSNQSAEDHVLLLPLDSDRSAREIRAKLEAEKRSAS
jgi:coenzyme F420-0:L-glutamate ligase/coenzyme F420-1:gamma-L-glutamate ligase